MKTSLNVPYQNIIGYSNIDISFLRPVGDVPDFSMGEDNLNKFGINVEFWRTIVIPALMDKFNNKCCICGSDRYLEVHHKSYEEQNINTLFLVCKSCHTDIHNSQLDNSRFIKYYENGLNDKEISEQLGVSKSSVLRRRHKLKNRGLIK